MDLKAEDILAVLDEKHKDWIRIRELRISSGFENEGRIDLWCINPAPSTGNLAISYEVKVSRSDFLRDTFAKQRGARLFSDRFYYATPANMLEKEDIPDWAGLVEISPKGKIWDRYEIIVPAPKLDKAAPSWGLVISILRKQLLNADKMEYEESVTESRIKNLAASLVERKARDIIEKVKAN